MLHIAHRGASGYKPGNTLSAFKHALKLKADMLELDVRVSKDGVPVVIHNKKVDKITDGTGKVSNLTLAQLKKLSVEEEETIPTLQEVLEFVHGRIQINIDLKEDRAVVPTLQLIDTYVKKHVFSYNDFLISAFRPTILFKVRGLNKTIHTAFNFVAFPELFIGLSLWMGLSYIKPHRRLLKSKLIKKAHKHNLKVLAWTVNSKQQLVKMERLHVDGIITDYPDLDS